MSAESSVDDIPGDANRSTLQEPTEIKKKGDEWNDDEDDAPRVLGFKLTNIWRLFKVFLAFPFVIIVAAIKPSGNLAFLRSISVIRFMNMMIYIVPFITVAAVLSQSQEPSVQIITIAAYIIVYLLPVATVVFSKIDIINTSINIEEGTFCFKPARTVRFTEANFYQVMGFAFEWLQHVLYVMPVGVVGGTKQAKLQDYPPYVPFTVWFWGSVFATFFCCLIIILNAVLRGKSHYKFQKSSWVWYVLFNVGSPMYVTIVTILFMGLWCDYDVDPPVLSQDDSILCYGDHHTLMARAALMALALYIVQHTLLPSGTFKETMGDDGLEIMFVPVYLSAHFLLKAVFCGVYVFFYEQNLGRIFTLTVINFLLLWINNFMKPCSIGWVNLMRNTIFLHASLSGIQSINFVFWEDTNVDPSLNGMLLTTLISNVVFTSIGMIVMHVYSVRSTEHSIAIAFLDLEWQVSHGGTVHPRVLEPLISLTLSTKSSDWDIVKKYIDQLVWLLSHKSTRVQFQAAWALANLAITDEDARQKIHAANGTRTLLEWYDTMDDPVQLESLAALANLSLSYGVSEAMVVRHRCIPFFLQIITSPKVKHSHFALVSLGNICRTGAFRDIVIKQGGMQVLVGCVMARDYTKLKFGALGLANLLLSENPNALDSMQVKGLMQRLIKIAKRGEVDTQREVVALLRNMSCHASLRTKLAEKGIMNMTRQVAKSPYEGVTEWALDTASFIQEHLRKKPSQDTELYRKQNTEEIKKIAEEDAKRLMKMKPLSGQVEWTTWGSKLDNIFAPVFASSPAINNQHLHGIQDVPLSVCLSAGVDPQVMAEHKDSINFLVVDQPRHGTLSEYETDKEYITYSPTPGYSGNDFFTYKAHINMLSTVPASITISTGSSNGKSGNGASFTGITGIGRARHAGSVASTRGSEINARDSAASTRTSKYMDGKMTGPSRVFEDPESGEGFGGGVEMYSSQSQHRGSHDSNSGDSGPYGSKPMDTISGTNPLYSREGSTQGRRGSGANVKSPQQPNSTSNNNTSTIDAIDEIGPNTNSNNNSSPAKGGDANVMKGSSIGNTTPGGRITKPVGVGSGKRSANTRKPML